VIRRLNSTTSHDSGASSVEYGLIIAAIAAVIVAAVFALGTATKSLFGNTSGCVAAGASSTC